MYNSISFIHIYLAPLLIILSVSRMFSRKDLMFSIFMACMGLLGIWEVAQLVAVPPYFYSIEAILLGFTTGTFLSLGLRDNSVTMHPKKNRVLAKLPLLGALAFLSFDNFYSVQIYRTFFIISILVTLSFYVKKNIHNWYFRAMAALFFVALIFQHFKMDEMLKSSFLTLGFALLTFKFSALEKKND